MPEDWFTERHTAGTGLTFAVRERLFDQQSAFQHVEVLDTPEYGRVLVLDDCVMLTERDEFVYHEMISHPALLCHPAPERVLIVGGGDGGTVRESMRHAAVQSVELVEIDPLVTEVSRRFFPALTADLDHPKVRVLHQDGFAHLKERQGEYDVILVDSTDPVGEAAKLFTGEFYQLVKSALRSGGVAVFQSESPYFNGDVLREVTGHLRGLYTHSGTYGAFIPTYPSGFWSFTFASDSLDLRTAPLRETPDWLARLNYFTPDLMRAAFVLPAYAQRIVSP